MIRKYEHVIQRTIQNIETHDFWKIHCNTMSILDQERRKRHGKGQANAQVSFEAAKRALIGYYYRCKYISVHNFELETFIYFLIFCASSRGTWAIIRMDGQSCSIEGEITGVWL